MIDFDDSDGNGSEPSVSYETLTTWLLKKGNKQLEEC